MKKKLLSLAFLVVGTDIHADVVSPRLSGAIDYQIGGASMPTAPTGTTNFGTLGLGAEWQTNMQCGSFDPSISISNQLNGITDGFKDMMGDIINNATGAVASLPALIIQRANPGLYDLLQQGVLQGKMDFEMAETSCESFQNFFMGDTSTPWVSATASAQERTWTNEISASGGDAVAAKEAVRDIDSGDEGIVWVCGDKAGGAGQPSIKSTTDVVIAGYGILHESNDICDTGAPSVASQADSIVFKYWGTALSAADWVVQVVGEVEVTTCDGCDKLSSIAGKGLEYKLRDEKEQLMNDLEDLVSGAEELTWLNLANVSAPPSVKVNAALIRQLQRMTAQGQAQYIERLSEEIAYARVIEQTRLAIRMLRAGQREPNVASFSQATPHIRESVDILTESLDTLRQEALDKRSIASSTIKSLLLVREAEIQAAPAITTQSRFESSILEIGE